MKKLNKKIYILLRQSERIFKMDMIYMAKGSFWITVGQIFGSLAALALSIAFANLIPKETFGIYRYVLSVAGLLSIFTLSGINISLIQSTAQGNYRTFFPSLKTKIRWGLLGSLFSLLIAIYYYLQGNQALSISFGIVSLFIPFMDSFAIYESFLQGKTDFKRFSLYNAISQILFTIGMVTVLFWSQNLFYVLTAYFLIWTILRYFFLQKTIKEHLKHSSTSESDSQSITYGKHLSFINVLTTIADQVDKILVFQTLGAINLSIYAFATVIPDRIKGILKNISILLLPKFSSPSNGDNVLHQTLIFTVLTLVLFLVYIIISPYVYKLLFPQYLESIFYSNLYAATIVFSVWIPGTYLTAKTALREKYIINISSSILKIALMIILITHYHVLGIIISAIITNIYSFVLTLFFITRLQLREKT